MSTYISQKMLLERINHLQEKLENQSISIAELEELTSNARELYERTLILRHKAYEEKIFGKKPLPEQAKSTEEMISENETTEPSHVEKEIEEDPFIEETFVAAEESEQKPNDEQPIFDFDLFSSNTATVVENEQKEEFVQETAPEENEVSASDKKEEQADYDKPEVVEVIIEEEVLVEEESEVEEQVEEEAYAPTERDAATTQTFNDASNYRETDNEDLEEENNYEGNLQKEANFAARDTEPSSIYNRSEEMHTKTVEPETQSQQEAIDSTAELSNDATEAAQNEVQEEADFDAFEDHEDFFKHLKADGSSSTNQYLPKLHTLVGAFSIADKLFIIQQLFQGSSEDFNNAINLLDTQENYSHAKRLISRLAFEYGWDPESKASLEFIRMVERRFQ